MSPHTFSASVRSLESCPLYSHLCFTPVKIHKYSVITRHTSHKVKQAESSEPVLFHVSFSDFFKFKKSLSLLQSSLVLSVSPSPPLFHGALGLAADPLSPSHLARAKPPAITIKAQAASQLLAPRYVANKKPGL